MSYFSNLLKRFTEPSSQHGDDLQGLREQTLNTVLIAVSVFGFFSLIINAIPVIQTQQWGQLTFFGIAYVGALIVAFNKKFSFNIRASYPIFIALGLAIQDIFEYGLTGDGLIWLFASVLLTGIFFGTRWTMFNWGFQVIVLTGTAYLIISKQQLTIVSDSTSVISWMEFAFDYIFLGFVATTGVNLLVLGLEKSLQKTQQVSQTLANERITLEQQTRTLERRLLQLRTVAEISRTTSGELTTEETLMHLVNVIQQRLDLYYAGVFLIDDNKEYAVLVAGSGETGQKMFLDNHRLKIGGNSMISWSIENEQARIALDTGKEAVRFSNPNLPLTRSELALPLKSSNQIIGAVTIQSIYPQAFDEDDIVVLQGLADSLATAIENSRLLEKSQVQLQELNILYNASLSMYSSVQSQDALLTISQHMLMVSDTQNYVISSWEEGQDEITTIYGYSPFEDVTGELGKKYKLSDYPLTEKVLKNRQIVAVRVDDPNADGAEVALLEAEGLKSLLMVPLVAHDKVIGLMELHDIKTCRDFSPQQVRLVEALSAHAAVVLEITDLIEQNQKTAQNERIINQITSSIRYSTDVESVLKNTLTQLTDALNIQNASIQLNPLLSKVISEKELGLKQ